MNETNIESIWDCEHDDGLENGICNQCGEEVPWFFEYETDNER